MFDRPCHSNACTLSTPFDVKVAAAQLHSHRRFEQSPASADRNCGTGTAAASESFSCTTFKNAQAEVAAVTDSHEPRIDALRKALEGLQGFPDLGDGIFVKPVHLRHCMGVAQRHDPDVQSPACGCQRIGGLFGRRRAGACIRRTQKRNISGSEQGHTHTHTDTLCGKHLHRHHPATRQRTHCVTSDQPLCAREVRDAACAITTLSGFGAVGIEHGEYKIGVRAAGPDHKQLIEPHSSAAVRPSPHECGVGRKFPADSIDQHEVIAEAVHLGVGNTHRRIKIIAGGLAFPLYNSPMAKPPPYWHEACRALSHRDKVMAKLIRRFPNDCLSGTNNAFETLCRAVIGQQISLKAADSIRAQLESRIGRLTPDNVNHRRHATLRQCGLSESKAGYLKNIARFFVTERITVRYWQQHDLDATRRKLTALKGVGEWTFQMFAIFYLKHPDIYPVGDLGLVNAIQKYYGRGRPLEHSRIAALGESWAPWRTVATWYLWRSIDPDPVIY